MATNSLGSLLVTLGLDATDYTAGLTKAERQAADTLEHIKGSIEKVAATLGIAFGVNEFKEFIGGAIEAAARLDDLSKKTGIAADTLGGIGFAAKQAGGDLESAVAGANKLNKSIAEAAAGTPEAAEAFKLLGVSVKDSSGQVESADVVLAKLADKFATYADGPNKTALAIRLFGKAGADMIPVLDQGGAKLQENIEYFRRYSGVTNDTAKAANDFSSTLAHLSLLSGALGQKIAGELLGPLQGVAEALLHAKEQGTLFDSVAAGIKDAFVGLATGAAFVVESLSAMSTRLDGLIQKAQVLAALAPAQTGNTVIDTFNLGKALAGADVKRQFHLISDQVDADVAKAQKTYDDFIKRISAPSSAIFEGLDHSHSGALGKTQAPGLAGKGAAAGTDDFAALLKQATNLDAVAKAELEAGENLTKFTDAQKLGAKIAEDYAAGLLKLTPAQLGQLDAVLKTAEADERATEAQKENLKWIVEATLANATYIESQQKLRDEYEKQAKAAQQVLDQYGLTQIQIKGLEVARLRELAATKLQLAAQADLAGIDGADLYREQAKAILANADALDTLTKKEQDGQAAFKAFFNQYGEDANNAAKQTKELSEKLATGLEDSLTDFLTTGKGGIHAFVDSFIAEIIRLEVVKPLLASLFGGLSGTSTGGGAGGLLGLIGGLFSSGGGTGTGIGAAGALDLGVTAYASGTSYVPKDGPAFLHQGERILTARENQDGGRGGDTHIYHVNVAAQPGMSRDTALQQGKDIADGLAQARSRNG